MNESQLPKRFDPIHLGKVGFCGKGSLSVETMERLVERLCQRDGTLAVTLVLGRDESGVTVAKGDISGEFQLICQRCLETMSLPIALQYQCAFVQDERALERLPATYEPVIVTEYVETSTMIEDEVLLALPIVALHDTPACSARSQAVSSEDEKVSPFAVLSELLKAKQVEK